jgi:hypothetical protein
MQKTPPADAPKPGQSEVRTTVDGTTEKYCTKCKYPQSHQGPKANTTSEHHSGPCCNNPAPPTAMSNLMVTNLPPEPNLTLVSTPQASIAMVTNNPTNSLYLNPGLMYDDPNNCIHFAIPLDEDSLGDSLDDNEDLFAYDYALDPLLVNTLQQKV